MWFVRSVLPLESGLNRFLSRKMRRDDDSTDLRQEVYARVYEAAGRNGLPLNARAFVFTTARNLLIDRARRERIVSMEYVADLETVTPVDDLGATERQLSAREELRRLQDILERLPPRCREVVRLRRIEQLSQRETAQHMGITEDTVERQLGKGVRILAEHFFGEEAGPEMTSAHRLRRNSGRRGEV